MTEIQDYDRASFGNLLKEFRLRRHLTQQQLATQIGVHRNAVGRWELGEVLPASKAIVLELARHLCLNNLETRHLLEASLTALAPYWSVPFPRNPFFTGREAVLAALRQQLGMNQAVALTQSTALHGLGGVGKTQIALEYAYQHALDYSAVFWLGAETEEQIRSSLLRIAEVLHVPEHERRDQQQVISAVQHWLTTHRQWLLIWDNVEDLTLFERFLPSSRSGAILLTTRRQALGTVSWGLDLVPMEPEEGILLLLRRAKILPPDATCEQIHVLAGKMPSQHAAAAELVTLLGGLPLALDQAGAFVEETQCGLPAYLDLFRTRRTALLRQRGEMAADHPDSVSTTFTLAIAATAERHPAVKDLLQICALLHPEAIPEAIFHQGAALLGTALEAICGDELEWNRLVAIACSYSLLSRQAEEKTLSLHRLVQSVLVDTMTVEEQRQWTKRALIALDAVFPNIPSAPDYDLWKQGERLLPHVLLCLHRDQTATDSRHGASLANKAARYLIERGQYTAANQLLERALQTWELTEGPNHIEVAMVLDHLARLYQAQNQYLKAMPLLQRALQIRSQMLGANHPEVATSLNLLGLLTFRLGKYREAELLYQHALQIWEQTLGPDHPDSARALNNLAMLKRELGQYAEAESLVQRGLRLHQAIVGSNQPNRGSILLISNLALVYQKQGRYIEGLTAIQQAIDMDEQMHGSDHLDGTIRLIVLAEIYETQGWLTEVVAIYQRILSLLDRVLGSDQWNEQQTYTLTSMRTDEPAEMGTLYQHAVHTMERVRDLDLDITLSSLGEFFCRQGYNAEAIVLLQHVLANRAQMQENRHPKAAQTLHALATCHRNVGNLAEASMLIECALQIRTESLGADHPDTVATRNLFTQLAHAHEKDVESAPRDEPIEQHPGSHTADRRNTIQANEHPSLQVMQVTIRGATDQVAYTRRVQMSEVTFTCAICQRTVTQLHYPSGAIKYCSKACREVRVAQQRQERVARQREKRQSARAAQRGI